VIIFSTELDEILALGDRIAVMYQGRIVDILEPGEATPERLGLLMGGSGENGDDGNAAASTPGAPVGGSATTLVGTATEGRE
jgi:hypothetical protein